MERRVARRRRGRDVLEVGRRVYVGARDVRASRRRDERGSEVHVFMRVEIACSTWSRLRGLLGRKRFDGVLLLMPCNDVHTFGMKAPIDIAFVEQDGFVAESKEQGDRVEFKDLICDQRSNK